MGLLTFIRNCVYKAVTRSRILFYLIPVLEPFVVKFLTSPDNSNHSIADASGQTIPVVKLDGRYFPAFGEQRYKTFSQISIRDSDVLLCGYPKTGCHWTFEILTMLVKGKTQLSKSGKGGEGMMELLPHIMLDSLPSPRVLNTHMRYEDLPSDVRDKKVKVVLTTRNPKDTCVSFFHHTRNIPMYGYDGEFDDYFKLFMAGTVEYGSFFDFTLAWDKPVRENPNEILMVKYEDLKAEPVETIKKFATFLGLSITDQFAKDVAEASSFKKMKEKRTDSHVGAHIFRKGKVGDWRNVLSEEQSAEVDKVWEERMTECTNKPSLN